MALALTLFAVSHEKAPAVFCYGYFRDVRGPGEYPEPSLPKDKQFHGSSRLTIESIEGLELVCWDKTFSAADATAVLEKFSAGELNVPLESPIASSETLAGTYCKPILVREGHQWIRCSGTGMLLRESIALEGKVEAIEAAITSWIGVANTAGAMQALLKGIAKQSALGALFLEKRRLGIIDRYSRAEGGNSFGPLLEIRPEKIERRSLKPMRGFTIVREFAKLDRRFTLHVTAGNYDDCLKDCIFEFPAGQAEVAFEADRHVTDITLEAFNPDGTIAQCLTRKLTQGMQFGLAAIGGADTLPKVKGAPDAKDLQNRPRLVTSSFSGPSVGRRSGGLDIVRENSRHIEALIGPDNWAPEVVWFERGTGQLEAIRWIKNKLETPSIGKAYLVDPFLGSDALQRVIARQGNDSINLAIVISPARVDPDADELDAIAVEEHSKKLVKAAEDWADKLCGNIEIYDIRRGENKRQAFHDRYLLLIDDRGTPKAYLLSNSLNRAAGDWAFAVCETNRVISRRVYAYVQDLLKGKDGDRDLQPVLLWKSTTPSGYGIVEVGPKAEGAAWMQEVRTFVERLGKAAVRSAGNATVEDVVDEFLAAWPDGTDPQILAETIYQHLGYREQNIARIAARFSEAATPRSTEATVKLDELLLKGFMEGLPRRGELANCGWLYIDGRDVLVARLAQAILRLEKPTTFVRDQLNPIVDGMIQAIESQRGDATRNMEYVLMVMTLLNIGLEVALLSVAPRKFREGMAADYISWLARLMRSEAMALHTDSRNDELPDPWDVDFKSCAEHVLSLRSADGFDIETPLSRLLSDPLVHQSFKDLLVKGN